MSELQQQQLLLRREWKQLPAARGTISRQQGELKNHFVFMTWNHLADGLDVDGGFDTPVEQLQWAKRQPLIIQEIKETSPDIFCLQEANHSTDILAKEFSDYSLLYAVKLDSPCLANDRPPDGCALFFRRNRFQLRGMKMHIYTTNVSGSLDTNINTGLSNQNAIFACLYDMVEDKQIIIVTTHLKAKAGAEIEMTRNYQVLELLNELEEFRLKHGMLLPVIVCGDFNGNSNEALYSSMLQSPLNFCSVYNSSSREYCKNKSIGSDKDDNELYASSEPPYTTWKFRNDGVEKMSCIDYIWISECVSQLAAFELRTLPTTSEIGAKGLPCLMYPSDHLSLACKIGWNS